MIKRHTKKDGTTTFQVYGAARNADGKTTKVYVGSFETLHEAEREDKQHQDRQRLVRSGELPARYDQKRTLGEGLDAWLGHLKILTPEDAGARSYVTYESRTRNHVPTSLRQRKLHAVTRAELTALQKELKGQMSAESVNNVFTAIGSAFAWFLDQDWIKVLPTTGIKPVKVRRTVDSFRWIQDAKDVTKLLGQCRDNIREILTVLVGTGARLDECLHLRASDVDLDGRWLHVRRGRKGPTKSGKERKVPISDYVLPVLRARKLAAGKDGLLWRGRGEGADGKPRPLNKVTVFLAFKDAAKAAGLDTKLRPHDLRRTYASYFVKSGGSIWTLSKYLGHSSVAVTEKVYAHLAPDGHAHDLGRVSFDAPAPGKLVAMRT